jgi:hypothetical protein
MYSKVWPLQRLKFVRSCDYLSCGLLSVQKLIDPMVSFKFPYIQLHGCCSRAMIAHSTISNCEDLHTTICYFSTSVLIFHIYNLDRKQFGHHVASRIYSCLQLITWRQFAINVHLTFLPNLLLFTRLTIPNAEVRWFRSQGDATYGIWCNQLIAGHQFPISVSLTSLIYFQLFTIYTIRITGREWFRLLCGDTDQTYHPSLIDCGLSVFIIFFHLQFWFISHRPQGKPFNKQTGNCSATRWHHKANLTSPTNGRP